MAKNETPNLPAPGSGPENDPPAPTRDARGRLVPGTAPPPREQSVKGGRNSCSSRSAYRRLWDALEEEARARGVPFWRYVAARAFDDDSVLARVLDKLLPNALLARLELDTAEKPPEELDRIRDARLELHAEIETARRQGELVVDVETLILGGEARGESEPQPQVRPAKGGQNGT